MDCILQQRMKAYELLHCCWNLLAIFVAARVVGVQLMGVLHTSPSVLSCLVLQALQVLQVEGKKY